MAIYRGGKLVGAGGNIAPTIFTDGVTLEGDGSENNRVRVRNAGINTVHLGENAVTLAKITQGEANRVLVYDSAGALVEGQKYAPKAVWWGLNQTGRIEPQHRFAADYAHTAILRFKGSAADETYFGGDSLGDIMQPAPASGSFVATNVDRDYPDGGNTTLKLQANEVFQLPAGVWNLFCHVDDSGQTLGKGHLSLMQITSGADDVVLYHTPGWQSPTAGFGGTTFDLRIPLLRTDGEEYFYLRFRKSNDGTPDYAYFLLLEKLQ